MPAVFNAGYDEHRRDLVYFKLDFTYVARLIRGDDFVFSAFRD